MECTFRCMKHFLPLIPAQECRPLLHNRQHLKKATHRKYPAYSQTAILVHDNSLPSTECLNATLEHFHWKYLAHPSHSSDQITADAHQRENTSDVKDEVKADMHQLMQSWPHRWCISGMNTSFTPAIMWRNNEYVLHSLFVQTCVQVIHTSTGHPWKLFTVYPAHSTT
jgi:hypothetical protein